MNDEGEEGEREASDWGVVRIGEGLKSDNDRGADRIGVSTELESWPYAIESEVETGSYGSVIMITMNDADTYFVERIDIVWNLHHVSYVILIRHQRLCLSDALFFNNNLLSSTSTESTHFHWR